MKGFLAVPTRPFICFILKYIIFYRMNIFRVSQQDEITGLDEVKHKEKAYEFGELRWRCR